MAFIEYVAAGSLVCGAAWASGFPRARRLAFLDHEAVGALFDPTQRPTFFGTLQFRAYSDSATLFLFTQEAKYDDLKNDPSHTGNDWCRCASKCKHRVTFPGTCCRTVANTVDARGGRTTTDRARQLWSGSVEAGSG
jgi:hypothetical protein